MDHCRDPVLNLAASARSILSCADLSWRAHFRSQIEPVQDEEIKKFRKFLQKSKETYPKYLPTGLELDRDLLGVTRATLPHYAVFRPKKKHSVFSIPKIGTLRSPQKGSCTTTNGEKNSCRESRDNFLLNKFLSIPNGQIVVEICSDEKPGRKKIFPQVPLMAVSAL